MPTKHRRLFVTVVVVMFCLLAVMSVLEKSPAYDELFHITGGYSYWKTGDFRIQPTNGNLTQRWIALPLLGMDLKFPSTEQKSWRHPDYFGFDFGDEFFHMLGNDVDTMLFRARLMIVALAAVLLLVVYRWSRKLFGYRGALVSLVLLAFSPSFLAHSRLATSDLATAFTFTLAAWCLWRVLHRVTLGTVAASCATLSVAALVKFSAPLLAAVGVLMAVARLVRGQPLQFRWRNRWYHLRGSFRIAEVIVLLVVVQVSTIWLSVWAAYGFRYSVFANQELGTDQLDDPWFEVLLMKNKNASAVIREFRDRRLLPEGYLYGLAHTIRFAEERRSYLCGECRRTGWWYFHPYCYLVKSTIPSLLLTGLAFATFLLKWRRTLPDRRKRVIANDLYRTLPLTALLAVYWSAAISTNLNLGVRHLMPVFPPTFILCGVLGWWFAPASQSQKRTKKKSSGSSRSYVPWLIAGLLAWHTGEAVWIYPDFIPYFNQLIGGPSRGYRHLVDNNLDWGQDLPGLAKWLEEQNLAHQSKVPVYLEYVGTGLPSHYGIEAIPLREGLVILTTPEVPLPLRPGVYCVSATTLSGSNEMIPRWTAQHEALYRELLANVSSAEKVSAAGGRESEQVRDWCERLAYLQLARLLAYLRSIEPDAAVHYSIHVYSLDADEMRAALLEPIEEEPATALK